MQKITLTILLLWASCVSLFAANGDSIFNMTYIHEIHITFPYPNFYDSLINTNTTDQYIPVSIQFNNKTLDSVGIKVKGNSSFNNPSQKKSFKLDMNTFIAGQDLHGLKKLNFNNSFKDPSFMREKLMNDFLIAHQLPAPRTTYCNVYFNNQLWGIYTVVEEIDDEFCKRWFGNKNNNLFKGDPHGTLAWKGSTSQTLYESDYELKNNISQWNWGDLINLISFINVGPVSNLTTNLEPKLNTYHFVRQWAAMNLFSSLDSYIGSGHNYYLYHDSTSDKFQFIAWDHNEAFGSFKMGLTETQLRDLDMYYLSTPSSSRPLCDRMLQNPVYKDMYNQAYCELKYDFNNTWFDAKIDSLRNVIQQSVYNDPKKFYTNTKFDSSINYNVVLPGPQGLNVFGLKSFISDRATAIQNSLTNQGVVCWPLNTSSPIIKNQAMVVFPNPTQDILYIHPAKNETKEILNLMGEQVMTSLENEINLNTLSDGLYYLRCGNEYQRFLIRR